MFPANVSSISVPDPVPRLLRDLVHERTGMFFEPDRIDVLLDKLQERADARGCRSFLEYYYILRYDAGNEAEWRRVMDAFSVQETYFWREFDQVKAMVDVIVAEWFRRSNRPLRIWSAACATGEEPYSIAMALDEAGWGGHPIEIVASDASEAALQKAQRAIYRERSFRALPPALRERYFQPVEGGFALAPEIAQRVRFRWANLVEPETLEGLASAAVVFCRNVFIYFSPQSIARVLAVLARTMPHDGHLFVGASESLLKLTSDFDLGQINRAFVYRRQPAAA